MIKAKPFDISCERSGAGSRMSREAHVRFCERAVVKFRRATRLIVFNERHLRRVLLSYFQYHHATRTHLSLGKDCPRPRPIQSLSAGNIIAVPEVGGLHHRYERRAA
jgi:putative transposase